jgi:hypothetical protein
MDNSETNHVTDAPGTVLETEDPNALMSENKEPTDSKVSLQSGSRWHKHRG